jgi:hypothetical protein
MAQQVKDALVQAAERLLAFEASGNALRAEPAPAVANRIQERLHRHLSPIVGETGFRVILARAVTLTRRAFPGLPKEVTGRSADDPFTQLCAHLKDEGPDANAAILTALIVNFVNLLSTFIGEGLTWRLLRNAWPEVLPTEPPSGEKP